VEITSALLCRLSYPGLLLTLFNRGPMQTTSGVQSPLWLCADA